MGIGVLCRLFGKTRQAFYELTWFRENRIMEEAIILKLVTEIRSSMPRLGTRKMLYLLSEPLIKHDINIGRDKLFDLLANHGMLVKNRRRRTITTDSNHRFKRYPNLIKHRILDAPEQVWVSDITYLPVNNGYSYLSLVTDAYSKRIVGFHLSTDLGSQGALIALDMALANRQWFTQLIHHSDRGIQYCCYAYIEKLTQHRILMSMTEKGDPYENAIAERVNGILKVEFGLQEPFKTHAEAAERVATVVSIYNEQRPHASCDFLTPQQAHTLTGTLEKRWKNYPFKRQNEKYDLKNGNPDYIFEDVKSNQD